MKIEGPYSFTSEEIVEDVIRQLEHSALFTDEDRINGRIYRGTEDGTSRPLNSDKEDCVVIWTSGYVDQVSSGTVTINIFCKDVQPYRNGAYVPDFTRLAYIQRLARRAFYSLAQNPINYNLDTAIHTATDRTIHQSFVVMKLNYRHINK